MPTTVAPRLPVLTRAERVVAELIPRGLANTEIADELHITEGTAKDHVSTLLRKFGCRDRVALVLLQRGFDTTPLITRALSLSRCQWPVWLGKSLPSTTMTE